MDQLTKLLGVGLVTDGSTNKVAWCRTSDGWIN